MMAETHSARPKIGRFIWIVGIGALLFAIFMGVVTNIASASPYVPNSKDDFFAPALQTTATATPTLRLESTPTPTLQLESTPTPILQIGPTSTVSFSLATLGYGEANLTSPYGRTQYSFRMPEYWSIQTDGTFNLDLSYVYNQVSSEEHPALFGDLTVTFDDQILDIFPLEEEELDHYQLQVSLPSSLLADPDRAQHVIGLALDAGLLCEVPHRATLVIHPTSSISLTYSQRPLVPDLSRYPRPFFQRTFEPDSVRFVLPSQSTVSDLSNALAIAAKLGDLTSNRLVVSATTDVDLGNLLSTDDATTFDEHLAVIGQPQDNQLLLLLNDVTELPVSLHQQQLELATQGPTAVAPGDTFAYAFTITNTIDRAVDLSLIDPLPAYTEFVDCTPDCTGNTGDKVVTWRDNILAPAESINFSLTLRATDTLTGATFENTVTLVEADLGPVNADTLTSTVVADSSSSELRVSVAKEGDYFFVYDGRAVAQGDGVIQEILSPWSENRAILIVTGLSDDAVRKASQAMSSETRFPGMSGAVALVRDVLSPSEIDELAPTAVEVTLEDLGYQDQIIYGESQEEVEYRFEVPGWHLTDDASVDLYFSHSQLIDYENSGLTVLINREPVASIALSDETSSDGHVHINLTNANVRVAQANRLRVQINMFLPGGECNPNSEDVWFLIQNRSKIFLAHDDEYTDLGFDLNYIPYPFHLNPAMTDLLFALPDAPAVSEWEAALRVAAALGSSAAGRTIVPAVIIGSDLSAEELAGYHIIAIGRPSRNALIQQANAQLPQPFIPGSDEIEQRLDGVMFRLPLGVDLGYLQLIPSPWNEARAFLAITGTTDEGVEEATRILTDSPWVLIGDLALVRDDEVNTLDTRLLTSGGVAAAVATVVPEMTPAVATSIVTPTATITTTTPTPLLPSPTPSISVSERGPDTRERPAWLIPLIGINGVLALAIFAFAFWRARQKRS